jgi:GT2 family glycosyltransferase
MDLEKQLHTDMELSIIIVSYKCPDLLKSCIASIYHAVPDFDFEVIVVDNHSQDNSEELITGEFKQLRWINTGYNSGFSRANNLGIRSATGKYILLLNPDTEMKGSFLSDFIGQYKNLNQRMNLGLLGCRIISLVDKSLLVGSGVGFRSTMDYLKANPVYIYITRIFKETNTREYKAKNMHYRNHQVDFVSGACVMIEKEKIELNNLFLDEDFFLYFEDVEWSFRVKQSGLVNFFCADVEVYHINSAITGKSKSKFAQMQISEYLFFFKTLNLVGYLFTGLFIYLNFLLNQFLLKRNGETEKLNLNTEQLAIFKRYFWHIPHQFKRRSSSAKDFLKYV